MKLDVADVRPAGEGVMLLTLKHPRRPSLPAATPGAHVDIHLGDGRIRQYSLCGDPADASAYRVAILREEAGRGGSRLLHEAVSAGRPLLVSAPRNHFELAPAERHLLLAAGIGVTPLYAMALALGSAGRPFRLHVSARSREAAPLREEIDATLPPDSVNWHFGDEPGGRLDLQALLGRPEPGTAIQCCGPARFMEAVRAAASAWPKEALIFEAFEPLSDEGFVPEPFSIVVESSGATLPVPAERSALAVMRESGIELPSSCEIGVCGACECGILEGRPIHRDVVLSPRARRDRFIPCVSRAAGTLRLAV